MWCPPLLTRRCSSYPLVTLSTRAQVEARRAESPFLETVHRIVAREGVAGLYAGLDSAVFGISLTNFIYYYWFEWTRAFFLAAAAARAAAGGGRVPPARNLSAVQAMAAGAVAGSATVILTNPIWVVNTRMTTRRQQQQQQEEEDGGGGDKTQGGGGGDDDEAQGRPRPPPRPTSTLKTLAALLRNEGPAALFAGVVPALVLVANPILQYTLFEQLKTAVERRGRRVTPAVAFVLGALGKLFATAITYPYITVKSQMHVAGSGGGAGKAEGMTAAIRRVIREEGYAGLYKGMLSFLCLCCLFVVFEDRDFMYESTVLTSITQTGIGPKLSQSVLTAAFLFAFKDVLYEQTVRLRATLAKKRALR